jgi:hypothetical protein
VLEDEDLRQSLAEARSEYLGDVASGVDGHATERLLALLLETARGRAGQGPIERA